MLDVKVFKYFDQRNDYEKDETVVLIQWITVLEVPSGVIEIESLPFAVLASSLEAAVTAHAVGKWASSSLSPRLLQNEEVKTKRKLSRSASSSAARFRAWYASS